MSLSLDQLLNELDRHVTPIPVDELKSYLASLCLDYSEIQPFVRFGPDRYQRNLIHEGPAYQALTLCWRAGQRSPIHDHCGSACGVRVIRGTATETLFERSEEGLIFATGTVRHQEGQSLASYDADIHQISNLQTGQRNLVTLHIYSPPLLAMNTYSLTDPCVERFYDPIFAFSEGAGI